MTAALLIVTPMHDEEPHVRALHSSLAQQAFQDFDWFVVDDGSTDGTARELAALTGGPEVTVLRRSNDGGLIAGSAYGAWRYGVEEARARADYQYVMKLDADVRLPPDYLSTVTSALGGGVGIAGGVISSPGMREQLLHVPGPVKMYTAECYDVLQALPSAIGFDVMDEVAASRAGLSTRVVRDAPFHLARSIGSSEGGVHGRYRNGRVCRWTGYDLSYFLLHVARYAFRRPLGVGSLAMLVGYVRASSGPYPEELRRLHGAAQRQKLKEACRHPVAWVRRTYGLA